MQTSLCKVRIAKVCKNEVLDAEDHLAVEEPLDIQLLYRLDEKQEQKTVSVTMRTPGHDAELAVGFLFTEGIIQTREQVKDAAAVAFTENKIVVSLTDTAQPNLQQTERNFYTTSSCGVCGKASIDAIKTVSIFNASADDVVVPTDIFHRLPTALKAQQQIFQSTGGLHASALFDLQGNFIVLQEDVGRHNALDKLIGAAFLQDQLPIDNHILLLSGRVSFELIQKATMAGIKVVAAVGAPSSLAVQLAEEAGMTLVGFLRDERFNIYCGAKRVIL